MAFGEGAHVFFGDRGEADELVSGGEAGVFAEEESDVGVGAAFFGDVCQGASEVAAGLWETEDAAGWVVGFAEALLGDFGTDIAEFGLGVGAGVVAVEEEGEIEVGAVALRNEQPVEGPEAGGASARAAPA